jgi:hypothetical protein
MQSAGTTTHARRGVRTAVATVLAAVLALSASVAPSAKASAPSGVAVREKADFVFFTYYVFTDPATHDAYLDYIKRFRYCLTNGYTHFTGEDLAEIQAAGCRLFVYRWFNGYYVDELLGAGYYSQYPEVSAAWQEVNRHPDWLLNPVVPLAGNGAALPAYFFDWANPELRKFYIDYLVAHLDQIGYDGVFFDYIGDWALPDAVKRLWPVKHPEMTYNEAGAVFLRELRAAMGDRPIMGNQAHRLDIADQYYASLTHDVTESYATAATWGKEATVYVEGQGTVKVQETYYRPWDGGNGYKALMESQSIGPARKVVGTSTQFHPIDYVQPRYVFTGEYIDANGTQTPVYRREDDKPAIHYSYATAKLYGFDAYATDWASWLGDSSSFGREEVYFADLGAPVEAQYRETAGAVVRYYENGFVVVTRNNKHDNQASPDNGPTGSGDPVTFTPDSSLIPAGASGLWDVYAGAAVTGWSPAAPAVEIRPDRYDATASYYPSGRVYLYKTG